MVTPNVCVVTRAQRAAKEQEEKNDDKDDSEGDSTSDSSDNDTDSKSKDEDSSDVGSDEELPSEGGNEEARKNDRQLGKDLIKESEWQRKRQIHWEVSQAVRETQREGGKTLPTPKEFIPLYHQPAQKKPKDKGEPTKAKNNSGRVDKVIREVFKQTKANISVGQLLEIAPYCRKRIMAALQEEEEESAVGPPHSYHVKAQDYDEEMPMITVVTKNKRVPNVLIDGGSGVNIITNALRKKLGLINIETAPFTIKMADQRKMVPVGLIKNLKIDVGGVKKMMTFTVIDLPPTDNDYEMMLGRTWLKQAQAKHDWGTSKITL